MRVVGQSKLIGALATAAQECHERFLRFRGGWMFQRVQPKSIHQRVEMRLEHPGQIIFDVFIFGQKNSMQMIERCFLCQRQCFLLPLCLCSILYLYHDLLRRNKA